jgi:predicted nucleic acid-binding protein
MPQAELEQWILLSNWHAKRIDWLRIFLALARFAIVPSSRGLVLKWAEVMVAARRVGRRLETADAWIASTAIMYDAPLITHNGSDYSGVPGLKVITEVSQ